MRYRRLRQTARFLDQFIDSYRRLRRRKTFPHKAVEQIIPLLFRGWRREGRGAFKTVYRVTSTSNHVALKRARGRHIRRDMKLYKALPGSLRNRYFAKIYWHTKYCLLQKYGRRVKHVPSREMQMLKRFAKDHGISDIRAENIRKIDGRFKIVDANRKHG